MEHPRHNATPPTRRSVLTGGVALAAVALSGYSALELAPPAAAATPPPPRDPDFPAAVQPVDLSVDAFGIDNWYVWCGTPAYHQGRYYTFYSRWPTGSTGRGSDPSESIFYGFSGWMKYSEIALAVADHPHGPYTHVRTILSSTDDPNRWDQYNAHNPHVREFDGKWYLYYIATRPTTGQSTMWLNYHKGQRIGVVVADTFDDLVNGRGRRSANPIAGPDYVNTFQMAVNPSVDRTPAGTFLMTYKCWDNRSQYITVVGTSDSPEGPFTYAAKALATTTTQAEDPYLWYDHQRARYYAIVKDFYSGADRTNALTPQYGALALVTSRDGIVWDRSEHPLVSLKQLRLTDGSTLALANLERPQLLFDPDTDTPIALFCAMRVGSSGVSKNVSVRLALTPVDLALGKAATASSTALTTGREPSLAVDGSTTTRWASKYADPQWIQIDLGAVWRVTRVDLHWEAAYGKQYRIQVSGNATTWTDVHTTTTGQGGLETLTGLGGVGRYIRMLGERRGTSYGYSLWRFSVYGSADLTL
ncbi:discoidin domain-containing protein [Kitasatospora sp. NBC_00240]|uniref:galactose-binding domain-containing protein n=1 Tax=Kitasatospora sp. NBC_00240 TaxID=2903567 RepID=UPI0022565968|nr:discoidin domain-containing protein [Kitasatospora sp. NBC_00240]MCX5208447.1 discoidin domain-containing protein [Kitasatospora sp. NBC_00240]